MNHLVFLDTHAGELEKILSGMKTMVIKELDPAGPAAHPVCPGDSLYFLRNDDEYALRVKATVVRVLCCTDGLDEALTRTLKEMQPRLRLTEDQYNDWSARKRVVLVEFSSAHKIGVIRIAAHKIADRSDWIAFEELSQMTQSEGAHAHPTFTPQSGRDRERSDEKMNPSDSLVIETHNLSKTYRGVQALKGLNLAVPQHSIFGFLGPNGAGKTTTMKLLLGLIRPTSGGGTVFGQDIVRDSVAIRSRVGYLPQQPRFGDHMSAREALDFTARFFFSGPRPKIEARIEEMLDLVGLQDKADRPVNGFSGGERQRLGLALAQINYPDLLILDEPASALDPIGRHEVLQVMEQLRAYTTIFYSTHILNDVQQVSDAVAILNRGELVAQGPVEALLAGGGKPVYTLSLKGDGRRAMARIQALPWVSGVRETARNGQETWEISVTDEQAAEAQLLGQVLAGEALTVVEFSRKKLELEEIFMSLVEGGQDGR